MIPELTYVMFPLGNDSTFLLATSTLCFQHMYIPPSLSLQNLIDV